MLHSNLNQHTVIRCSVGTLDVVHEVLDERYFILSVDYLKSRGYHLNKEYDIDGHDVNLKVVVLVI